MAINFKFLKRKCDGSLDESSESKMQIKSSDTDPGLSVTSEGKCEQSSFQTFERQRDNPEHVLSANDQWLATSTLDASDNVHNSYQGLPEHMKQLPDVCKESERDKPYQCYICDITFESANSFLEHSNALHKPDRQKEEANIAQSIVTDANTLVMGGTLHTCRDCNILFSDYDTLLSHIKQQHQSSEDGVSAKPTTTVKRHQCYVCGKTFPKPLQVKQHLKSSHPEEIVAEPKKKLEGVQCPYCPKYFAKTLFLKYHVRDKHNEFYNYWLEQQGLELFNHKCKICKDVRVFKTLDYLKDHIRMSHKEEYEANEKAKETEPFLFGQMCLICSECFIDTPALQEHADVHKDDSGLFPCSIHCEEKFEKYFQVMNHYVRHRLRSFGCLRCAAKFVRFRQWVAHNAKHHGYSLGQFTCAVCEKDFPIKLALETHMKTMHKENVRCPNCGAYFTDQHMVEKHVAKKHSVQELA